MNLLALFVAHIVIYGGIPYYFATLKTGVRITAFYVYISILLTLGGFVGSVYSFPITDSVRISGGNLLYGALMMTSILFVILERDIDVLRRIIRVVITVNVFKFLAFSVYAQTLKNPIILNPFETNSSIFSSSLFFVAVGGVLIIFEQFLLLLIFERLKKRIKNVFTLSMLYTLFFVLVLCLDGVLFPAIALSFNPNLAAIVVGNVQGKLIMALAYSLPILLFLLVFRRHLVDYIETPLKLRELLVARKEELIAEIQRQEQAIAEGEARYHRLTENARDMIFRVSLPDGRYEYVNPASVDLLGYTPQELYHSPELGREVVHPDWKAFVEEKWNDLVDGKVAPSYEYQIVQKSGEVKWLHQRNVLVEDEKGRPIATEGIITNITERVLAETTLRKSEERFRTLLKNSPIGIIQSNSDMEVIYENSAVNRIFGVQEGGESVTLGRDIGEVLTAVSTHLPDEFNNLPNGEKIQFEMQLRSPYDKESFVEFYGVPLFDNNEFSGGLQIFVDITEQKLAKDALQESENKYRQLIDLAQEGIWLIDKDSNTTFVNPSMAEMLGYSADEMMGRHLFSFMDEEGVEIANRNLERRRQGIAEQHDFEFLRKDGTRIIVAVTTAPMIDKDGDYAGAIAGMMDITERIEAVRELQKLNIELDKRVHERTERLNTIVNAMAGREVRMAELKKVIKKLREQLADAGIKPAANDPLLDYS